MNLKSAQLHFNTGKQLKEAGKFDEVIGHSQTAIEIKPNFAAALANLGSRFYN